MDPSQMTEEQRKELEEKLKNMSPEEIAQLQKQQCIFCQIISGQVPSKKIFEDEKVIAILDVNPATEGHVLLLPKEHYAIMPQMSDDEIAHIFSISKKISQVILKQLKVEGTNIFVANGLAAGQRAQHFMVHIIPRKDGDDILTVPEHLVEIDQRKEFGIKIVNKMNELMGIKKKKVEVEKKEEIVEAEFKEDVESGKEEVKEEKPKNKKVVKEEPEKEKEDDGVSVDDIASLFK